MQTQPKTGWLSHASQAKQGHRKNTGSDGQPSDVPAVAKATVQDPNAGGGEPSPD